MGKAQIESACDEKERIPLHPFPPDERDRQRQQERERQLGLDEPDIGFVR
jgi:hypothetical protein